MMYGATPTLPGRFRCYSCSGVHGRILRDYDESGGQFFPRSIKCKRDEGRMQEIIEKIDYARNHEPLPSYLFSRLE